jgi:hypothetical protein
MIATATTTAEETVTNTATDESTAATSGETIKPDLYIYILSLVDQLAPDEQLQLVTHIVKRVQPLVIEPPDEDDDEDDEELAREAEEALEYARAHPESVHKWEDVKAELMRAEAAGELPD